MGIDVRVGRGRGRARERERERERGREGEREREREGALTDTHPDTPRHTQTHPNGHNKNR